MISCKRIPYNAVLFTVTEALSASYDDQECIFSIEKEDWCLQSLLGKTLQKTNPKLFLLFSSHILQISESCPGKVRRQDTQPGN